MTGKIENTNSLTLGAEVDSAVIETGMSRQAIDITEESNRTGSARGRDGASGTSTASGLTEESSTNGSLRGSARNSTDSNTSGLTEHESAEENAPAFTDDSSKAFVDFLRPRIEFLVRKRKSHACQILMKPKQLHENIGMLSDLLGFDSEDEMTSSSSHSGLFQNSRHGPALPVKKWKSIASCVEGFDFHPKHGRHRQNLFVMGELKTVDINAQMRSKRKPPVFRSNEICVTAASSGIRTGHCREDIRNDDVRRDDSNDDNAREDACISPNQERINRIIKICPICSASEHGLLDCPVAKSHGLTITFNRSTEEPKKKKHKTKLRHSECGGHVVEDLPSRCKCIEKNTLRKHEASIQVTDTIRSVAKKKKIDLSMENTILVGTFAARFPQMSDIAIEQAFAAGAPVAAMEFGLTNCSAEKSVINFDAIAMLSPSRTAIKNHVKTAAAHKTVVNGNRMLKANKVCLGTDHGGGVLVKMALFWDKTDKRVSMLNPDFDESGHDAESGGKAIKNSMRKCVAEDDLTTFAGGSSDSGGGFTKDAMKRALVSQDLANAEDCIHVNCTEHNDQTALRVACNKVCGSGQLDSRNALQLIHAFADVQKAHEGSAQLLPRMKDEFRHVRGADPPKSFPKMMQEPTLTRWKTVGEACQCVNKCLDVLVSLCESISKMSATAANSQIGKTTANFLSLAKEPKIVADLAFTANFDEIHFVKRMEFNRFTDEHIGSSGFIAHHHLVRCCIKIAELEALKQELWNGSIAASPIGSKLTSFWQKLHQCGNSNPLKKARLFIDEFIKSIHKHSAQFISPELLFLACFGEHVTSCFVAKPFFCFEDDDADDAASEDEAFESPFHKKTIRLEHFNRFITEKCLPAAEEAKRAPHHRSMELPIRLIANKRDVWDGSAFMAPHKKFFLENCGALPSTSVWVERAVKKAKLCQRAGSNERNVTAHCIAGDDTHEKCSEEHVSSSHSMEMAEKRKRFQDEGTGTRCSNDFEEDLTRGPSSFKNVVDHSQKLMKSTGKMKQEITDEACSMRLSRAVEMLTKLPLQGSCARHSEELLSLQASRVKAHRPSAREQVTGVDKTPLVQGKIPHSQLRRHENLEQMRAECIARGIPLEIDGKEINFAQMKTAIQKQEREKWIAENPRGTPPDEITKNFTQQSTATFVWKEKQSRLQASLRHCLLSWTSLHQVAIAFAAVSAELVCPQVSLSNQKRQLDVKSAVPPITSVSWTSQGVQTNRRRSHKDEADRTVQTQLARIKFENEHSLSNGM